MDDRWFRLGDHGRYPPKNCIMPITQTNQIIRQYHCELPENAATKFLDLFDALSQFQLLKPALQTNVNLHFGGSQITGDVSEARSLISQVNPDDQPHSLSGSITTNTNPRRTLSVSLTPGQKLFNFNLHNASGDEAQPLVAKTMEIFPETEGAPAPGSQPSSQEEYLPGAFRPTPMPAASEKDVFVIMSFQRQHRDAFFLAIKPVLEQFGLNAVRVDQIQHNTTVTPEIMRQIERCLFVVADLTGERPNVYYEVGYAHRADKEVILLSRKDTSVHFDVAAINRIEYEDYTELTDSLRKRVLAIADRRGISLNSGG